MSDDGSGCVKLSIDEVKDLLDNSNIATSSLSGNSVGNSILSNFITTTSPGISSTPWNTGTITTSSPYEYTGSIWSTDGKLSDILKELESLKRLMLIMNPNIDTSFESVIGFLLENHREVYDEFIRYIDDFYYEIGSKYLIELNEYTLSDITDDEYTFTREDSEYGSIKITGRSELARRVKRSE
jgi:hypothetical protein